MMGVRERVAGRLGNVIGSLSFINFLVSYFSSLVLTKLITLHACYELLSISASVFTYVLCPVQYFRELVFSLLAIKVKQNLLTIKYHCVIIRLNVNKLITHHK